MVRKITKEKFLAALDGSTGIISVIMKRLNVSARKSIYEYMDRNPWAKQALDDEREKMIDYAESALISKIKNKDFNSIKWYLATMGKHRGYTEKQEIEHSGDGMMVGAPMQVNINIPESVKALIDQEREKKVLPEKDNKPLLEDQHKEKNKQ